MGMVIFPQNFLKLWGLLHGLHFHHPMIQKQRMGIEGNALPLSLYAAGRSCGQNRHIRAPCLKGLYNFLLLSDRYAAPHLRIAAADLFQNV